MQNLQNILTSYCSSFHEFCIFSENLENRVLKDHTNLCYAVLHVWYLYTSFKVRILFYHQRFAYCYQRICNTVHIVGNFQGGNCLQIGLFQLFEGGEFHKLRPSEEKPAMFAFKLKFILLPQLIATLNNYACSLPLLANVN